MRKKVNFEVLFKTLTKKHLENKCRREQRAKGLPTSPTESGRFSKLTEFTISRMKPKK